MPEATPTTHQALRGRIQTYFYGLPTLSEYRTNHQYFLYRTKYKDSTTPSPLINTRCMLGALLGSLLDVLRYPIPNHPRHTPRLFAPRFAVRILHAVRGKSGLRGSPPRLTISRKLLDIGNRMCGLGHEGSEDSMRQPGAASSSKH